MTRNYRQEYDNYHSKPEQKKNRASRNKVRRKMVASGRVKKGDYSREVDHIDGNPKNNNPKNLRLISRSANRRKK
ncbi:MAG: HNH endonuclease [Acidimicrobiaceae bacterium]|nr:HNH endonuclease [Acidimicrobiaceae bacterium]